MFSTAMSPSSTSPSSSDQPTEAVSPVVLYAVAGVGAGIIIVVVIGAVIVVHRCTKKQLNGNQVNIFDLLDSEHKTLNSRPSQSSAA